MDLETRVMIPRHEQINDLACDDFLPKLSGQKTCSDYFRDHISRKLVWMVEYILFENFTQNQGMDVWVKIKLGAVRLDTIIYTLSGPHLNPSW